MLEAEQSRYDHLLETEHLKSHKAVDDEGRRLMEMLNNKQQAMDMLDKDIVEFQTRNTLLSE